MAELQVAVLGEGLAKGGPWAADRLGAWPAPSRDRHREPERAAWVRREHRGGRGQRRRVHSAGAETRSPPRRHPSMGWTVAQSGLPHLDPQLLTRTRRSNACPREGARLNPGLDPLDPLELALLIEAAEDLADLDRDDTPGEVVAEDCGQDEEP